MTILQHKVFAYITHASRLLIFRHLDFPEAGLQVPAGTVEPGEDFAAAVLREAQEETGLDDLYIVASLGEHVRDMSDAGRDAIHHRHFYHLRCAAAPPERWQHDEADPSDGSPAPIRFEFYWVDLPDGVPELICDHDKFIPLLLNP